MPRITNYKYKGFTYIQNATPPSDSESGDIWLDNSLVDVYVRDYNEETGKWLHIMEVPGDEGIFAGGQTSSTSVNIIEYINISSINNTSDFGDLTVARYGLSAASNGTDDRGIFGGGDSGSNTNVIDYITISTPGNATDFGDLTVARYGLSAASNGTDDRGIFGGGIDTGTYFNIIDYVTISSTGNTTDFGDLTVARYSLSATSNT